MTLVAGGGCATRPQSPPLSPTGPEPGLRPAPRACDESGARRGGGSWREAWRGSGVRGGRRRRPWRRRRPAEEAARRQQHGEAGRGPGPAPVGFGYGSVAQMARGGRWAPARARAAAAVAAVGAVGTRPPPPPPLLRGAARPRVSVAVLLPPSQKKWRGNEAQAAPSAPRPAQAADRAVGVQKGGRNNSEVGTR